jgi:CheY-like chemotaxis protein
MTSILLLEDNPDMLAMLAQVLEWGGYEVLRARNGVEGMQCLQTQLPHIIISDISMPEMGGLELLERVRATPEWAGTPFVLMSAHSAPEDRRHILDQGADEFLVKPFNLVDFQKVLARFEVM